MAVPGVISNEVSRGIGDIGIIPRVALLHEVTVSGIVMKQVFPFNSVIVSVRVYIPVIVNVDRSILTS